MKKIWSIENKGKIIGMFFGFVVLLILSSLLEGKMTGDYEEVGLFGKIFALWFALLFIKIKVEEIK